MKIGAQVQLAMQNLEKQVELAKKVASETVVNEREAKREIEAAKEREAEGALGQNVDVEA